MRPSVRLVLAAISLTLYAAAAYPPPDALANGTPVRVVLGYMPGISNWGPRDAAGVAELVFKEGEVRLSVVGLPRLGTETYNIWLLKAASGAAYNLGRFNVGPDGTAHLDYVLPEAIPEENWDLMLISVEDGGPPPAPGPRRSIAGRIEPPEGAAARGARPSGLPRTGGDEPARLAAAGAPQAGTSPILLVAGGFGAGATVAAAAGIVFTKIRRRSR